MKYEPVFKFAENCIFITDLFLPSYKKLNPLITIKNGEWEFFLYEKELKNCANEGFKFALSKTFYKKFEKRALNIGKKVLLFNNIKFDRMNNAEFVSFLEKLFKTGKEFLDEYKKTEFFYFAKIEKELKDYIGEKISFQELLAGKINIKSWPKEKRKLAEYIINMQHLKLKLRGIANKMFIGSESVLVKVLGQIVLKTKRNDAASMTLKEVIFCLNSKKVKDVSGRHLYSYIKYKKDLKILSGIKAKEKIELLRKNIPKTEVKGIVACKGIIKGIVKIIPLSMNPEKYLSKMEKGNILVSDTTGPEMVVAIRKAAAIVTDEGGLMSHASVISREFNIPCIVGTKYATKIFKDGDYIEVDAEKGVVRKL